MNHRNTLYEKLKPALSYCALVLPLLGMDTFIRILAIKVNYFQWQMVAPSILFSLAWIGLIVGVCVNLPRLAGRIAYGVSFSFLFLLFLTNSIYYTYTGKFFSFKLLSMAGAGKSYIWSTVLGADPLIYLFALVFIGLAVLAILSFPPRAKGNYRRIIVVVAAFIVVHTATPLLYGRAYDTLQWDAWRNPRNVYNNFNDANKNIKLCGLFEYSYRDFHKSFLSPKPKKTKQEQQVLENAYEETTVHDENPYTGMLAGKNVIFLQLEGIDTWLLTPEDMPNLYRLMSEGMQFTNHYSYYTGGGSTFNSELAVNTGFITPVTYYQNAYAFNTNLYPYSLPNLFKALGYRTNAFHMNTGEYYIRELNYRNWGYDGYHGLMDLDRYENKEYELDRYLVEDETFYEALFAGTTPFLHQIITYTPHTPFTATEGKGLTLAQERYGQEIPALSEEECARLYAGETDRMVGLLLTALEENGLLESTVIVAYADHYMYTLNDKTILEKYKDDPQTPYVETDGNLINRTPFFIWSQGMTPVTVEKVNSQVDILPTVLNLFGIDYYKEHYIGADILSEDHPGIAFFSDYAWYDGQVYVENGEVVLGQQPDTEYIIRMSTLVSDLIWVNDLTLKYDHFRELTQSQEDPAPTDPTVPETTVPETTPQ